jgi:hypothetical protein
MSGEEKIKTRAHEVWESEGRTTGRENEHWERASCETAEETEDHAAERGVAASDLRAENLATPAIIRPKDEVPPPLEQVEGMFTPDPKSKPTPG